MAQSLLNLTREQFADGIDLNDVFAIVERFREHNQSTGIVLMGYTNPIEVLWI